jgi:hypothetical protein
MNPEPTDLNDLAAIARTTKSARYRRALSTATSEIEHLRARVKELGDAWLCRIEGKFEDVDRLLGNAVGKEIQAYEIDTSHHESTDNFDKPLGGQWNDDGSENTHE